MMNYSRYFIPLVIALSLGSCNNDEPANPSALNVDSIVTSWLASANISAVRDASGIYYFEEALNPSGTQVGSAGQVLAFYYTLMDLDSNFIASHRKAEGDSLLYKYASNAIFPVGIDEVINVMRVGETYNFIIPPDQGYADATTISTVDGSGIVLLQVNLVGLMTENEVNTEELRQIDEYIMANNLNDTISVTIERIDTTFLGNQILSIDTTFRYQIDSVEYYNSGVRYKELNGGAGQTAQNGDTITIDYSVEYLDGSVITSSSNFTYELGSGIPDVLIPGIEFGLTLLSPSEQGIIIIPSSQGYRESARIIPQTIIPELIDAGIIPDYVADVEPYRPIVFNVNRIR